MKSLALLLAVGGFVLAGGSSAFADDYHRRFHDSLEHREYHRQMDHDRFHDYLEHRQYHRYSSPYSSYHRSPYSYYRSPYTRYYGSPYNYYRSPSYYRGYSSWGYPYSSYSSPFRGYSFHFSF